MKRLSSLLKRRRRQVRPKLTSVYGPQCLEDRSLMALVADGIEFLVNTQVPGDQQTSASAASIDTTPDGASSLVVFGGPGPDDAQDVFARRLDADGVLIGNVLSINGTKVGEQTSAAVAHGTNRSVVVWSGRGGHDNRGIYASIVTGTTV